MYQTETLIQLNALSNNDLVAVYYSSIRILKDRGIYSETKKNLKHFKIRGKEPNNEMVFKKLKTRYNLYYSPNGSTLIDIMNDDWSELFSNYDNSIRKYYVYYHTKPYCQNDSFEKEGQKIEFFGQPFYIGKGTGDRYKSLNRNKLHTQVLNELLQSSFDKDDVCKIFVDNLTEAEAMEIESKLITFFGCKNEIRKKWLHGRYGGQLLNTDSGVRPKWIDLLIRENNAV